MNLKTCAVLVGFVAACGGQPEAPDISKVKDLRGATAKADGLFNPEVSCESSCGRPAYNFNPFNGHPFGFCHCDDLCGDYGDCCNDKVEQCDAPPPASCETIEGEYQAKLQTSTSCQANADCQAFVGGDLKCGVPNVAVNNIHEEDLKDFGQRWQDAGCHEQDWMCPMYAPPPPWIDSRGICTNGTCQLEWFDTRGAQEGETCGDTFVGTEIEEVACADGLYCAYGLNWCGTPPVSGICRKHGDCGADSDCSNLDNNWFHPMCVGHATCDADAGSCSWHCGAPFPD